MGRMGRCLYSLLIPLAVMKLSNALKVDAPASNGVPNRHYVNQTGRNSVGLSELSLRTQMLNNEINSLSLLINSNKVISDSKSVKQFNLKFRKNKNKLKVKKVLPSFPSQEKVLGEKIKFNHFSNEANHKHSFDVTPRHSFDVTPRHSFGVTPRHSFDVTPKTNFFEDLSNFYLPKNEFENHFNNEVHNPRAPAGFFNSSYYKNMPPNFGRKVRWRHLKTPSDMKKVIVRTHNVLRGKVSPPAQNMLAMTWNSAAAEQAQEWADECRLETEADHPSVRWTPVYGSCGQNVHIAAKKKRWGRVVRSWWNERKHFRYGLNGNNLSIVGKYTQMVWYNSHKVGCAFSQCVMKPSGKTFYRYVCNYCPAGNDPRQLSHPYMEGNQCDACPASCRSTCNGGSCRLCTNSCPFSDLWVNCKSLAHKWKGWLCNTKTKEGVIRFKNCRSTCQCQDKIT